MGGRIHFIDNLRGVLILLVVLGHFYLNGRAEAQVTGLLYSTIYLFHMPLFVFVSGFLAKRVYTKEKGLRANKIINLVVLGFLFQAVIIAFYPGPETIIVFLKTLNFGSTPWYLISLASWYLITPVLARSKPLPTIIVSVVLGLLAGCVEVFDDTFSIARTFMFLPFFVTGYYCSTERLERVSRSRSAKVVAVAAALFVVCYWMGGGSLLLRQFTYVYGNSPYPSTVLQGVLGRGTVYLVAVWLSVAVVSIIPKREVRWLAFLGKNTLSIYVFHRIIKCICVNNGLFDLPLISDPVLAPLFLTGIAVLVTLVCLLPFLRKPLDAFMRLKWSWLFGKEEEKPAAA
ncbi:MAG: acyltransferase family protein [Coriobacteriales bacterium]|jgi:fucose 4-O-acetylase-like acetyltransferase